MSYIVPLFVRSYCNRLINQFSFVGTITKVDERMFLPSNEMSIIKRIFRFPYILEEDKINLLKSHLERNKLRVTRLCKLARLTIEILERSIEETRVTNVQSHLISALENSTHRDHYILYAYYKTIHHSCKTAKGKKKNDHRTQCPAD